jgi:RNA recognition motif-containing protein
MSKNTQIFPCDGAVNCPASTLSHYHLASSTNNPSQMSCETLNESLPIPATESNILQPAPVLRVGNLNVDVTERTVRKVFGRLEGIISPSISRDSVTRNRNGIGLVKFINVEYDIQSLQTLLTSANTALNPLNKTFIDDRPCQLTWYQRNQWTYNKSFNS